MSRLPDLVRDSRLHTEFVEFATIHSFLEIDDTGKRFSRQERWEWDRLLGRGGFGQVKLQRRAANDPDKTNVRAVKIIQKTQGPSDTLDYNRELEAIAKFSHHRYRRWFVKSFGWFDGTDCIFVAMEYCQHGDLQNYLVAQHSLPPVEVQQLAHQIVEGLDQMHQNEYAHRDLKPGNILIKSKPPDEQWWIVLADFGITKRADENTGLTTAIRGTTAYMAPELRGYLDAYKPKSAHDFMSADMWALGEIVFRLLTGEEVFQGPLNLADYSLGRAEFPSRRLPGSMTKSGRDIVAGLMAALPGFRLTASQCLQHRWWREKEQDVIHVPKFVHNIQDDSARWSELSETESFRGPDTVQAILEHSKQANTEIPQQFNVEKPEQVTSRGLDQSTFVSTGNGHIAFSSAGQYLAVSVGREFKIWETGSGGLRERHHGPIPRARQLLYSATNKKFIALLGSYQGENIQLWDVHSAQFAGTLQYRQLDLSRSIRYVGPEKHYLACLACSPHGSLVAASSLKDVQLWHLNGEISGETLRPYTTVELPHQIFSLAFTFDNKYLACCTGYSIYILHTILAYLSKRELKVFHWTEYLVFSPNGKHLATSGGGMVHLYSCDTWELLWSQSITSRSGHLAFSPKDHHLAISHNSSLDIWDVQLLKKIHTISDCSQSSFSPDGRWLVILHKNAVGCKVRIYETRAFGISYVERRYDIV